MIPYREARTPSSGSVRPRNERSRLYRAVCDRCGIETEVPFSPSSDKPVYCIECFNTGPKERGTFRSARNPVHTRPRNDHSQAILELRGLIESLMNQADELLAALTKVRFKTADKESSPLTTAPLIAVKRKVIRATATLEKLNLK